MSDKRGSSRSWLRRLRHEWTKNDGRPFEEWDRPDLKETVMTCLLAIITAMMVLGSAVAILRS